MIYFVQAAGLGFIKIGFVQFYTAAERVQELQIVSPVDLNLLKVVAGTRRTEKELHQQFASARVRGEWFKPVPELLALIESTAAIASDLRVPQTMKDAQGRDVRLWHSLKVKTEDGINGRAIQHNIRAHVDDASPDFLIRSLWERLCHIGEDVESLKADVDHVNGRLAGRGLRPIQMTFKW